MNFNEVEVQTKYTLVSFVYNSVLKRNFYTKVCNGKNVIIRSFFLISLLWFSFLLCRYAGHIHGVLSKDLFRSLISNQPKNILLILRIFIFSIYLTWSIFAVCFSFVSFKHKIKKHIIIWHILNLTAKSNCDKRV